MLYILSVVFELFSQVFDYRDKSLRVLFGSPSPNIHDLTWIDDDSYAIAFVVMSDN